MRNSDVMNHRDIRKGPPGFAGRPESKRPSEDDVCRNINTKNDNIQQAGYVAEVVLERLREDHRWFRGHAVACENLGRALKLGIISPAKADYLRQQLTGEWDGYCNMGAMYRARYRADAKWGWA